MLQNAKYRCCFVYFDGFYSPLKNSWNWPQDFNISRAWTWKGSGANNFPPFLGLNLTPKPLRTSKNNLGSVPDFFVNGTRKMPIFRILNLGNKVPNLVSEFQNALVFLGLRFPTICQIADFFQLSNLYASRFSTISKMPAIWRTCTFIRDVVGGHTCAPDRSGPRAWHVYLHSWRGRRVRMCSGPRRGKIVSNLTWRMLRFSAICQIASNLNCWQFQTNCWELPNSQQFQTGRDFWRSNCQHFPGPNCQQFDKLLGIWRSQH